MLLALFIKNIIVIIINSTGSMSGKMERKKTTGRPRTDHLMTEEQQPKKMVNCNKWHSTEKIGVQTETPIRGTR